MVIHRSPVAIYNEKLKNLRKARRVKSAIHGSGLLVLHRYKASGRRDYYNPKGGRDYYSKGGFLPAALAAYDVAKTIKPITQISNIGKALGISLPNTNPFNRFINKTGNFLKSLGLGRKRRQRRRHY